VLSAFGIVIGIATFVVFLASTEQVAHVLEKIFPLDQVKVVAPSASLLGKDISKKLDDSIVKTILARQEVKAAVPRMSLAFPAFGRGSFEGSLNVNRLNLLDADSIFRLTQRLVNTAADEGNAVIVGRGGAFFLENRPDAFHVFIYAPYEDKVRRLIRRGTEPHEAARLVDTVDNDRADFIKRYFDKEWPDRHLYHLMINSRVGDEAVVRAILNGMAMHDEQAAPPPRSEH